MLRRLNQPARANDDGHAGRLAALLAAALGVCCGLPILLGAGITIGTVGTWAGSALLVAVGIAMGLWGWRRRRRRANRGQICVRGR